MIVDHDSFIDSNAGNYQICPGFSPNFSVHTPLAMSGAHTYIHSGLKKKSEEIHQIQQEKKHGKTLRFGG